MALILALLLAACAHPAQPPSAPASAGPVCRVGPNGGPVTADRGIGGTGIDAGMVELADRGIGGTGIVGVVTGFASVCVDGLEVAYTATTPVDLAGTSAGPADLRAGQVVAIDAGARDEGLYARKISVRYEVVGPVQSIGAEGVLSVAGQRVLTDGAAGDPSALYVGDWVAVSGLRRPEGAIVATRIERTAPGLVTVHGRLDAKGDTLVIGGLPIGGDAASRALIGQFVTASGRYDGGALVTASVVPDLLMSDPPAYFGRGVSAYVIESFVRATDAGVITAGGFMPRGDVGGGGLGSAPVRAVITLQRNRDNAGVTTTRIAPVGSGSPMDVGHGLQAAPVGPRGMDRPSSGIGAPAGAARPGGPPVGRVPATPGAMSGPGGPPAAGR